MRGFISGWRHWFFEGDFGDRMLALGFGMDCGESFIKKWGFAEGDDPECLEASLEIIGYLDVLGAAIFST